MDEKIEVSKLLLDQLNETFSEWNRFMSSDTSQFSSQQLHYKALDHMEAVRKCVDQLTENAADVSEKYTMQEYIQTELEKDRIAEEITDDEYKYLSDHSDEMKSAIQEHEGAAMHGLYAAVRNILLESAELDNSLSNEDASALDTFTM